MSSFLAKTTIAVAAALIFTTLAACGGGVGVCIGSGGALSSPECKENWTKEECDDWDAQGINGADWTFNSSNSCSAQGYPEECSDGSWRQSGAC